MLCHARGASPGSGLPVVNKNNHPFVSEDLLLALVHNGKVPNKTYKELIKNYKVNSDCDSEVLLRIFQSTGDKLEKIKKVLENAYESHMAIAIGEIIEQERRLYLFRNEYRSLYFVDMMEELNQLFFVSTEEIWDKSVSDLCVNYKIQDFPIEEVWILETNNQNLKIEKFEATTEGFQVNQNKDVFNFNNINIKNKKVYTNLNEHEESLEYDIKSMIKSKELCSNIISDFFEIEEKIEEYFDKNKNLLNELIEIENKLKKIIN